MSIPSGDSTAGEAGADQIHAVALLSRAPVPPQLLLGCSHPQLPTQCSVPAVSLALQQGLVTARLPQLLLKLPQEQGQKHREKAAEIQTCHIFQRMKLFPPQAAFNAEHIRRHLDSPTQMLDENFTKTSLGCNASLRNKVSRKPRQRLLAENRETQRWMLKVQDIPC